jgi:hypothetical protein
VKLGRSAVSERKALALGLGDDIVTVKDRFELQWFRPKKGSPLGAPRASLL